MKLPRLDYACPISLADVLASGFASLPGAAAISPGHASRRPDATSAYRKTLLGVMLERALRSAQC